MFLETIYIQIIVENVYNIKRDTMRTECRPFKTFNCNI